MRRSLYYLPLLYLLITFVLLILPGNELPKAKFLNFDGLDKIIHTIMFFLLTYLFCRLIFKLNITDNHLKIKFGYVVVSAIVYGVVMEVVQKYLVPFRAFEMADIAADTIGAVAGYFVSRGLFLHKK